MKNGLGQRGFDGPSSVALMSEWKQHLEHRHGCFDACGSRLALYLSATGLHCGMLVTVHHPHPSPLTPQDPQHQRSREIFRLKPPCRATSGRAGMEERTPQGEPALQAGSRAGAPPSIRQGLGRDRPWDAPGGAVKPLRRDGARRRRHRIRRWRPVLGVAAIVMTAAADSLVIV